MPFNHINSLPLSDQNSCIFHYMADNKGLKSADKKIAAHYSAHRELISMTDSEGFYPIQHAADQGMNITLQVLVRAENRPTNHWGQLLRRKGETEDDLLMKYLNPMDCYPEDPQLLQNLAQMYLLLPYLCKEDQTIIAEALYTEATEFVNPTEAIPYWLTKDLILDLPLVMNGRSTPFIDAWVDFLCEDETFDPLSLLDIEGMIFTKGVNGRLVEACEDLDDDQRQILHVFIYTVEGLRANTLSPAQFGLNLRSLFQLDIDLRKYSYESRGGLIKLLCSYGAKQALYFKSLENVLKRNPAPVTARPLLTSYQQPQLAASITLEDLPTEPPGLTAGHTFHA